MFFGKRKEQDLKTMTDEELNERREKIRPISISANVSAKERNEALNERDRIDKELSRRAWLDKEEGYPKHSDGGWYLSSDD